MKEFISAFSDPGIATIAASVVAGVIALLVELHKTSRNGKALEKTQDIVTDTKGKTEVIKESTSEIKAGINMIQPDISRIDGRTQVIATEIMNFRNLQQEKAGNIDAGAILASVSAALQDYTSLKRKLEESESNVQRLTQENERLSSRNRFLEQQLNQSQEPDWEMEP